MRTIGWPPRTNLKSFLASLGEVKFSLLVGNILILKVTRLRADQSLELHYYPQKVGLPSKLEKDPEVKLSWNKELASGVVTQNSVQTNSRSFK